jgi:hypothetical protein
VLLVVEMVLKTPSFLCWTLMYTNNNVTHRTPRAPDLTILTNVNTILSFMSWIYLAQYTERKILKAPFIPLVQNLMHLIYPGLIHGCLYV